MRMRRGGPSLNVTVLKVEVTLRGVVHIQGSGTAALKRNP